MLSRPGSVLSSSGWRLGIQPNSPRCPGQSPMTEDGLAPVSAGPRRAPYPPATPIQGTWGARPWLPARPRKQTSGHCTGVLPILFLDFSRLSCFLLETCRFHVCAGKHRGVQPKTHTDPQVPARPDPQTCGSRGRLPALPDLPLASGLRAHTSHPPPRTDRPSRTPFGSDRDAAARMVEVSGSSVPAGVGRGGFAPANGLEAHRLPHLGPPRTAQIQILLVRQCVRRLLGTQHCRLASLRFEVSLKEHFCYNDQNNKQNTNNRYNTPQTVTQARSDSNHAK